MEETVVFLSKSEGISNIKKTVDLKNYIVSVSFSFRDPAKINGITKKLLDKQKSGAPQNLDSFDKTGNTFKRIYRYSPTMKTAFNKLQAKDREIFKSATYTSIFRFQNLILSGSNTLSKISPCGKAIMLNTPAMELIFGTADISNNIQLAR